MLLSGWGEGRRENVGEHKAVKALFCPSSSARWKKPATAEYLHGSWNKKKQKTLKKIPKQTTKQSPRPQTSEVLRPFTKWDFTVHFLKMNASCRYLNRTNLNEIYLTLAPLPSKRFPVSQSLHLPRNFLVHLNSIKGQRGSIFFSGAKFKEGF